MKESPGFGLVIGAMIAPKRSRIAISYLESVRGFRLPVRYPSISTVT